MAVKANFTWEYTGMLEQPQAPPSEDQPALSVGPLQALIITVCCLASALASLCLILYCVCSSRRRRRRNGQIYFDSGKFEERENRVLSINDCWRREG